MADQLHNPQGVVDYGGSPIGYYGHFSSSMHNSTTSTAAPTIGAEAGSPPIGSFVNGLGNMGLYQQQQIYHANNLLNNSQNAMMNAGNGDYLQHRLAPMVVPTTPLSPSLSTPPIVANRSASHSQSHSHSHSHGLPPVMGGSMPTNQSGTNINANGNLLRHTPQSSSSIPHIMGNQANNASTHPTTNSSTLLLQQANVHTLSMVSMNTAVGSFGSATGGEGGDALLCQYKAASELDRISDGRFTLETVRGHVYAFAMDPDGSRALQRLISEACGLSSALARKGGGLDTSISKPKQVVVPPAALDSLHRLFVELEEPLLEVISNTYGHFTVQKLIETQSVDIILRTIRRCRDNVFLLAQDSFGSRIVQSLVESILLDEHKELLVPHVSALIEEMCEGDNVYNLIRDQNGNHVLQKCLLLATQHCASIPRGIAHRFVDLATHVYGSRVIQCAYEQLKNPAAGPEYQVAALQLMILAKQHANELVMTQFGNFVVSHALINSPEGSVDAARMPHVFAANLSISPDTIRKSIIDALLPNLLSLASNKFASNVAQRLFVYADEQQKGQILWVLTQQPTAGSISNIASNRNAAASNSSNAAAAAAAGLPPPPPVVTMMNDQFANYVIQAILEHVSSTQKYELCERMKPYVALIATNQCGRHILCKYTPSIAPASALAAHNASSNAKGGRGGRGGAAGSRGGRGGTSSSTNSNVKRTIEPTSTQQVAQTSMPSYSGYATTRQGYPQSMSLMPQHGMDNPYNSFISHEGTSMPSSLLMGAYGFPGATPPYSGPDGMGGYGMPQQPMQPFNPYQQHHQHNQQLAPPPQFQQHQGHPPFYIPQSQPNPHALYQQPHLFQPFNSAASTVSSGQTIPAGRASADTNNSSSGPILTHSSTSASAASHSFGMIGAPAYPSFLSTNGR